MCVFYTTLPEAVLQLQPQQLKFARERELFPHTVLSTLAETWIGMCLCIFALLPKKNPLI